MYAPNNILRTLLLYKDSLIIVLSPLLLSPIIFTNSMTEAKCGYVIILMAVYWMTEAVPVPVTALIPVFAFPLLGVLGTGEVCKVYMKETNMMFLGGLTVAIAVEHCNLHRRIALKVILVVGQSPRSLVAGFMFTTMFLSMWISNTATTAMMVPIVEAIITELYSKDADHTTSTVEMDERISPVNQSQLDLVQEEGNNRNEIINTSPTFMSKGDEVLKRDDGDEEARTSNTPPDPRVRKLRDMCLLATAYSANIGGTGSLTGTGPNLVLKNYLESNYDMPTGLNFLSWMLFNVPGMIICVLLSWLWLQIKYLGLFRKKTELGQEVPKERMLAVKKLVEGKYRDLGPMRFQEGLVLTLFTILVLLWLFRAPEFIDGWAALFDVKVDDATPAMLIVFLLFCFPAKLNFWCFAKPGEPRRDPNDRNEVLTWKVVQEKIPWGVVLLLGGGFAMAEASDKSGLSTWLGAQLYIFNGVHPALIVFIVTLMTAMLTEVASNTATASILIPVLNELALNIDVNPIYLMLPAAVCCSYAFMLPVATPPNAIVFSVANMKSTNMMKVGVVMNVVCVLVLNVMINTLGVWIFDLNNMPPWTNSTLSTTATTAAITTTAVFNTTTAAFNTTTAATL